MSEVTGSHFLGPEGVQQRMQEIRAKLTQVFGAKQAGIARGAPGTFDGTLKPFDVKGPGVRLSGVIGNSPTGEIKAMIDQAAQANNVDPRLLDSVVAAESSYDPGARSRAGAMGLAQLMPDTAAGLGVQNPFDPSENLNGGAKYLRQLLDKFQDIPTALAAYNAGPNAVTRHGGIPPYPETRAYVERIMAAYNSKRAS